MKMKLIDNVQDITVWFPYNYKKEFKVAFWVNKFAIGWIVRQNLKFGRRIHKS